VYSGNIDSAENDSKLQTEAIIVIHDCIHVQVFGVCFCSSLSLLTGMMTPQIYDKKPAHAHTSFQDLVLFFIITACDDSTVTTVHSIRTKTYSCGLWLMYSGNIDSGENDPKPQTEATVVIRVYTFKCSSIIQ